MSAQSQLWIATARLVRRSGFGATGPEIDAALRLGSAAYVRSVMTFNPATDAAAADAGTKATPAPSFTPIAPVGKAASKQARLQRNQQVGAQLTQLAAWWVRRMVSAQQPSTEKLTFCWHNHFATAASKVREPGWLLNQNQTLRRLGRGDFATLASAMLTDAAMLYWLDGQKNTATAPNENLSREFMELFALGHGDGYTETDVREGARALTGWKIRLDGTTYLNTAQHDGGTETLLGVTGNLDVTGFRDAVLARPSSARYLATRWWGQLVSDTAPSAETVTALADAYGSHRDLGAMFTTMLTQPEFSAAEGSLVIDPVEWLIGATRALRVAVPDDTAAKKLLGVLRALGQIPFYPPNVSGWPSGQAWLSTAAADARMQAALSLANAGDLSIVAKASTTDRLDAVGYLLGVGAWSARTTAVLRAAVADPPRLVAIALNTPEYLVH
ncbi:MAG: DUF1800 domain-containing protein [Actinomycetota bacterium]|nr:DUF1800 domain-containing protein [Actinomycetota bacterium]